VGDNLGYYGRHESVLRGGAQLPALLVGCYAGCRHLGSRRMAREGLPFGAMHRRDEGNLQRESLRDIWLRPGVCL